MAEWRKNHTTQTGLRLNHTTDIDILEWLDKQESKQGAIKKAIRYYIRAATHEQ